MKMNLQLQFKLNNHSKSISKGIGRLVKDTISLNWIFEPRGRSVVNPELVQKAIESAPTLSRVMGIPNDSAIDVTFIHIGTIGFISIKLKI